MPIINPSMAYQQPSESQKVNIVVGTLPNDWFEQLIQMVQGHLVSGVSVDIAARFNYYVGPESTYNLKKQVIEGLKIIYGVMKDPAVSDNLKVSIASQLAERSEECTAGFHDGVNAIVDGFSRADSMNTLLSRVRHEIVSRIANQTTDEVHTNNRFFTIAQRSGFGVTALNPKDVYIGYLADDVILNKLKEAFDKYFQLFNVCDALKSQIFSELLLLGYTEIECRADVLSRCEDWLVKVFKDTRAVFEQNKAKETHESLKARYDEQVDEYIEKGRIVLFDLLPKNTEFQVQWIDNIIKNNIPSHSLRLKMKYDELLLQLKSAGLSCGRDNVVGELQMGYQQLLERLGDIKRQIKAIQKQLISPFLSIEDESMRLNWSNITLYIMEEMRSKAYFTFTENEVLLLDCLLDSSQSFDFKQFKDPSSGSSVLDDLFLSGSEVVILSQMGVLSDTRVSALLKWYVEESQDRRSDRLENLLMIQQLYGKNNLEGFSFFKKIQHVVDELMASERVAWLEKFRNDFNSIPKYLRQGRIFILEAIRQNAWVFEYVSAELKNNKEFVLALLKLQCRVLKYVSDALKNDREVVLEALKQDGGALLYASDALRNDREVVLEALKHEGGTLFYASLELRKDKKFVMAAVKQNSRFFKFASDELQMDLEFIFELVKIVPSVVRGVPSTVREEIERRSMATHDLARNRMIFFQSIPFYATQYPLSEMQVNVINHLIIILLIISLAGVVSYTIHNASNASNAFTP